ncbi:MAG: hypothetical protein KDA24_08930 [Deltaproteobacteria bacterium]|nr:hypothetical protein [Deltaproteobacteria bacterium]
MGGELCVSCKRRLLAEGTPWTPQEKARAEARRYRGWSERGLRLELVVAAVGALVGAGAAGGWLPGVLRFVGTGTWLLACALGLGVAASAGLGWSKSEAGRPGPAVQGVYPSSQALLLAGLGLLPLALSLASLLS